jgi:uncharacterized UPF0146 family protein
MLRGAQELAEFIRNNYGGRVVEVGVGRKSDVALLLEPLEVVATDIENRPAHQLSFMEDDIFSPREEIYEGASLLYSLRPPLEVQLAMGDLALKLGADVLIRPLEDEIAELPGFARSLINLGEARFYLFRATASGRGVRS